MASLASAGTDSAKAKAKNGIVERMIASFLEMIALHL
jgi:hypothetical protein